MKHKRVLTVGRIAGIGGDSIRFDCFQGESLTFQAAGRKLNAIELFGVGKAAAVELIGGRLITITFLEG